jgi:4-amino-4-deoxy-L-arabinose transferase-like glycosyltransferase
MSRRARWVLLGLCLLAFAVRVYDLELRSLWSDEGLSLYRARVTLGQNLSNVIVIPPDVPTRDTNPPLYFVLLSGVRAALGEREFALRFLSVLAGVALVPLLFVLGRRWFSVRVGLIAALLGALSPFLVWYAQEARMYTLLLALSVLSVYLLLRAVDEMLRPVSGARRWGLWAAWMLTTLTMLATHFNSFFVLTFEGLYLLIVLFRVRRREAVIVALVLALLAVPLVVYALSRAQYRLDPVFNFRPLESVAQETWSAFLVGAPREIFQPWWAVAPGLLLACVGVIGGLWSKRWRQITLWVLVYLLAPLLSLYVASHWLPLYIGPRHIIFVLPPFYLLVALGAALIWERARWLCVILISLVVGLMTWWQVVQFTDADYLKDDIRAAACTIAAQAQPDDVVIMNDAISSYLFDYYYQRCDGRAPWKIVPTYPSLDFDEGLRAFQAEAETANRVWFLTEPQRAGGFDTKGLDEWARGHWLRLGHQKFASWWLGAAYQLYTAHFPILTALPLSANPSELRWPAIPLRLMGVDPVSIAPERDRAQITYYWQVDRAPEFNLDFTTRLVDSSGAEWGLLIGSAFDNWSAKKWPIGQIVKYTAELVLPHGLPPGEYAVRVKVANRQTGEAQTAADGQDEVEVARITIK